MPLRTSFFNNILIIHLFFFKITPPAIADVAPKNNINEEETATPMLGSLPPSLLFPLLLLP